MSSPVSCYDPARFDSAPHGYTLEPTDDHKLKLILRYVNPDTVLESVDQ